VLLLDPVKTVVLPDPVTEVLGPLSCVVILPSRFELIIVVPALPPLLILASAVIATGVPAVQLLSLIRMGWVGSPSQQVRPSRLLALDGLPIIRPEQQASRHPTSGQDCLLDMDGETKRRVVKSS
jgi:hypothetical protein